jgi:DNA helicase IV
MNQPSAAAEEAEVAREQHTLDVMYGVLDELRAHATRSARDMLGRATVGTAQGLGERDAMVTFYEKRAQELNGVEERLCFGRLDHDTGIRRYIGRIGLAARDSAGAATVLDGTADDDPLLVDWRAPVAAPFYQATPAAPGDVIRRRHLTTHGRTVVAVEDEVLDLDALTDADRGSLVGEGALLAAVNRARTGRMGDIVATMQSEQDRIVRSDLSGVLVVQGGPGTGKTAVALHRIAYLLYTHRERLDRSGVLMVGPSPVFLRYIERVLPALGETGTVMRTPGTLYPGVEATRHEPDDAAVLKGDLRMAEAMKAAVQRRQRVPRTSQVLSIDGVEITLRPEAFRRARARARSSGSPHNKARLTFVRSMLDHLVDQVARAQSLDLRDDPDTRHQLTGDLRDSIDVRRAINLAWMPLTPERVLARVWQEPSELAAVAPWLSADERAALLRTEAPDDWTIDDVPLLDELAELIGDDDEADRAAAAREKAERQHDLATARESLQAVGGLASQIVTAEMLVDRNTQQRERLSVAEHAERDRGWVFGHLVVDEAQELSAMQWRLLARRCPSRSMTLVGDVAQTGSPAGASDWSPVLDALAGDRWRREELTVNYRTPRRIVDVAVAEAAAAGLVVAEQTTMRDGDYDVDTVVSDDPAVVVAQVEALTALLPQGRVAVIAPATGSEWGAPRLRDLLVERFADQVGATGAEALERRIAVLDPNQSKGLEVDAVVLVDPEGILDAGRGHGAGDLYVAMTRATQAMTIVRPATASR